MNGHNGGMDFEVTREKRMDLYFIGSFKEQVPTFG